MNVVKLITIIFSTNKKIFDVTKRLRNVSIMLVHRVITVPVIQNHGAQKPMCCKNTISTNNKVLIPHDRKHE